MGDDIDDLLECIRVKQKIVDGFLAAPWKVLWLKKKDPSL
jgi:hypothetical protein